jgi:hypothetical protein
MIREIESSDPNYLLNVSVDDYCNFLIAKYCQEVPVIHEEGAYILTQEEVREDGSRRPSIQSPSMLTGEILITIAIPFEGNNSFFDYQPSTYDTDPPVGMVNENELHLTYQKHLRDIGDIKSENTRKIEQIKKYLDWMKRQTDSHNIWIKEHVKENILKQKAKILRIQNSLESLDIPIKKRTGLLDTYMVPILPKKIAISKPLVQTESFKPEPSLQYVEYENILEIMLNMSLAMERSPKTFSRLHEEEIRDFFLIMLNGQYEGQATGETFNVTGKTDILI